MNANSEIILTFLFNAGWQLLLIAAVASLGGWLIRGAAVCYQHWLCVAALLLSFGLPVMSAWQLSRQRAQSEPTTATLNQPAFDLAVSGPPAEIRTVPSKDSGSWLRINPRLASVLLGIYLVFLCYRFIRFGAAWWRTLTLSQKAYPIELSERTAEIVAQCQTALGVSRVRISGSDAIAVPVTIGVFRRQVLLPAELLRERDSDVLRSAIGHELAHVRRRDYLLNLIYELIYLPLSFHPAAALVRRRINQTRELVCDALVAEKLLDAQAYARSLVRLVGSAASFGRPAMTVGIGDADILEVRIMSLIGKSGLRNKRSKLMLVVAAMALAVPVVAATTFAVHLTIDRQIVNAQEPSRERVERTEQEKRLDEMRAKEIDELKSRLATETNSEVRSKLEAKIKEQEAEVKTGYAVTFRGDSAYWQREEQDKKAAQAELVRRARISMDQAIQIATSQQPGKAIETALIGEHWEAPGKLAKDGLVLYRVLILSGDETNPTQYSVLVNAETGSIFRVNKEEGRRELFLFRTRSPLEGGVLNGRATSLPIPKYPAIARSARAQGSVEVRIVIDEEGNVVEAKAISGHPLLQAAAVDAAREAKFAPTRLKGELVQVTGLVTYNFLVE